MPIRPAPRQPFVCLASGSLLWLFLSVSAVAQTSPSTDSTNQPAATTTEARHPQTAKRQIEIGHATDQLLALQRNSQSLYPRHIDGEQAYRSYQRYLKSFETAIPEHFDTGMDLKKK